MVQIVIYNTFRNPC